MDFIQAHFDLVDKVHRLEFFPHHLPADLNMPSLKEMNSYWFKFWANLPDAPYIQTPLFHEICDFMDDLETEIYGE